jgi:putative tricarboxylic transport membrane protein
MRGIAISSPKQLGGDVTGVPTWKEQGIDIEFFGLRGLIGPGGLSKDQIAYWDGIIGKVVKTKEFKAYAKKSGAVINYNNAANTYALLTSLEKEWSVLMNKLGLVKKKKKK